MPKPASSLQVGRNSLRPLGPAYGFREGSGATTADDAGVGQPGALAGGASWGSTGNGPVVRLTNNGDWVLVPFNPGGDAFETDTTAVTFLIGVKPTSLPGRSGAPAAFFHRQLGAAASMFAIRNVGTTANPGLLQGHLYAENVGTITTPVGLELTPGTAYILALRCQQNAPLRLRAYVRSTGQQVGAELVGDTNAANGRITLAGSFRPLLIGGFTAGSSSEVTQTIPGDYDFFFYSPTYLTDKQLDTFVANPFANYTAVEPPAFSLNPTVVTAGTAVTVTATGSNTSWTSGTTFAVAGGTGASISNLSVNVGTQTATFTLNSGSATGALTISDSTDSATSMVTVQATFDWLAAFESTMGWPATGQANAYPQQPTYWADGADHYDVLNVFEQVRAYTGSSSWDAQVAAAVDHYREQGVFANGGCVAGNHAYADGLLAHYERTGDGKSRDSAILVSQSAAGSPDATPILYSLEQAFSRTVAFSILTKLAAESLGCAHRPRMEVQVAAALGHVAQWTAPAGQRLWSTFTRPFMVGLTCEALIAYWDRYRTAADTGPGSAGNLAAQVPPAIKAACDWLWANCWRGDTVPDDSGSTWSYGGFRYTYEDLRTKFDPVPSAVSAATSGAKFRGGSSLSTQDDFYKYAPIQFTSGDLAGQAFRCSGYTGSTREFRFDYSNESFNATPGVGDAFRVVYLDYPPSSGSVATGPAAGQSVDTLLSPSLNPLIAPMYAWYFWYSAGVIGAADTSYRDKFVAAMSGSATLRSAPYSQKVYNQTYKWSIKGLRWYQRANSEYPAATALTLARPSAAGRVNAMSDRFTVALSGPSGSKFSTAAPVKVTPSDGGAGGTFFPATVVLTTDRPRATFRYRPASSGAKSIAIANDGSLAKPAAVAYTPSGTAPIATAITATLAKAYGPKDVPVGLNLALSPPAAAAPATADPQGGLITIGLDIKPSGTVGYPGQGTMYPPLAVCLSSDNPSLGLTLTPSAQSPITINYYGDGSLNAPPASSFKVVDNGPMVPPKLLSATIDASGSLLTLNFSTSVTGGKGFTLSGGHSLSTMPGSGRSQTYIVTPIVSRNEVLSLAYTPGNVVDTSNANNSLIGFSALTIANRSTSQRPPHRYPPIAPKSRSRTRPSGGSR